MMLPSAATATYVPQPVNLVATPLPGTIAIRVAPTAVSPSVSNVAVNNNAGGSGAVPSAGTTAEPAAQLITAPLSTLIPPSFSSSSASLSASAMFAAQAMGQQE